MVSPLNRWQANRRVDSELFPRMPPQAEEDQTQRIPGGEGGSLPPGVCLNDHRCAFSESVWGGYGQQV